MTDVVELTCALCEIPSISEREAEVVDDLAARLHKLGGVVQRQRVGDTAGRDNLLVSAGPTPELLLTTHVDTVPPFYPPKREGTTLVGRGVIDAKGIAAAMICAWERLLAAGETRVGLLFVVGEETNSDGAKAAAQGFAPPVRSFINGEPTDGLLVSAMKGVLAFELVAQGRAAHSAYPQAGHSAIHQLAGDVHRLLQEPWHHDPELGPTTLNVGTFEGGVAANVLAPTAKALCLLRTTKDADALEAQVRGLLSKTTQMRVLTKSSPQRLMTVPGEKTQVVAFGSDVPHLARLGAPLMVGPGSILHAHTAHEHVEITDLRAAVDTYERLALHLLRHPQETP